VVLAEVGWVEMEVRRVRQVVVWVEVVNMEYTALSD